MTLKLNGNYFVLDCTHAEYVKNKPTGMFTGFRWNPETKEWRSPHVLTVSTFRKNYKKITSESCPMTAAAAAFFASEVERVKGKPRCGRCAGTGMFITYVENGVPKGPGGICFRCNGKGHQDASDERRNDRYDEYAASQALRGMM